VWPRLAKTPFFERKWGANTGWNAQKSLDGPSSLMYLPRVVVCGLSFCPHNRKEIEMNRICVSALALAALAGAANAQVEFRFVERTGQTVASSADSLLEIAVQARVTGGSNLGGFNFNISTTDSESAGTLQLARTMNGYVFGVGNAYYAGTPWTAGSIVGIHGLAGQYSYLAGINGYFNGLVNQSQGTFTNNPALNEIGLIAGAATGNALLQTPGMDSDGNSVPDTAPSNGSGISANNEVAPLDPSLAGPYFANGQFIDIFRFRYTVSNFTQRDIVFSLGDLGAQTFDQLLFNNGAWGAENVTADAQSISAGTLTIHVTPTPASVALLGLGGLVVARRRRA
jgi:MYXO-CTERM domain-containing protein